MIRALLLLLFSICSILHAQEFTITQYQPGGDMNGGVQLMQFTETTDGKVYHLYFYFDSGVRNHRVQVFDGNTWNPISRPCERCINHIFGGDDGQLYAASDNGILRYETADDTWSTYLADPAFRLALNPDGQITFLTANGAFDYDGTTVTARNNTNVPDISNLGKALYDLNGDLYTIMNGKVHRQDANGWTALSDVTSPIYLELAPDGKVYVTDNFGGIHYYENQSYTSYAITGVFPSLAPLKGFAINQNNGVFWGATQGPSTLRRHERPSTTASIPVLDLIPTGVVINEIFIASNNLVFVVSNFQPYITTIDDGTVTRIFEPATPTLEFSLSPNPSKGHTQVKWRQLPTGSGTIELFNAMGQSCYQAAIQVSQGDGQLDILTAHLPSGNYWVVFRIGKYFGCQQITVG